MVAKKDFNAPKHDEIDVPNLQVIKALQSLDSKQYVKTQFSWQYYYYTLTDEGIEYLREYLHLPSEIFPATFKKTVRTGAPRRAGKNLDCNTNGHWTWLDIPTLHHILRVQSYPDYLDQLRNSLPKGNIRTNDIGSGMHPWDCQPYC